MNALPEIFSTLAERIGWALLHSLWQGAIIAAALAVSLTALRRRSAAARHAACLLALLALPFSSALTLALLSPSPDQHPASRAVSAVESAPVEARIPSGAAISGRQELAEIELLTASWRSRLELWLPSLSTLWTMGVCFCSLCRFNGWRQVRRLRREAGPARPALLQALERLRDRFGLRHTVRLLESVEAATPMLIGFFTPAVLLPVQVITGLSSTEVEAILAHELAHLVRRDAWSNLAQLAIETLFFYHPALWWIGRRAREEREIAADDLALRVCADRRLYAGALLHLAEIRHSSGLALAATGGSLLHRIRRVVNPAAPEPAAGGWSLPCLLVATVASALWIARVEAGDAQGSTGPESQSLQATPAAAPASSRDAVPPIPAAPGAHAENAQPSATEPLPEANQDPSKRQVIIHMVIGSLDLPANQKFDLKDYLVHLGGPVAPLLRDPALTQSLPNEKGGFNGFLTDPGAYTPLVTALESEPRFHIISRPTIFTRSNQMAMISSGTEVPHGKAPKITYTDTTTETHVLPLIGKKGGLQVEIFQKLEGDLDFAAPKREAMPKISTRIFQTVVTLQDKATVILDGSIKEASIAGAGSELVVILQPEVTR